MENSSNEENAVNSIKNFKLHREKICLTRKYNKIKI